MNQPVLTSSQNAPAPNGHRGFAPRNPEAAPESSGGGPSPSTGIADHTGDITGRVRVVVSHDEDLTPVIGRPKNRITP